MFRRIQSVSFSIGQLTFGSFTLLLAMIAMTSIASVVAIRHIDATFAELQHLQSLGDVAEEIDRRTRELRLAARDFVTDPAAPSGRAQEAASSLSALLKNTRLETRARAAGDDRRRHAAPCQLPGGHGADHRVDFSPYGTRRRFTAGPGPFRAGDIGSFGSRPHHAAPIVSGAEPTGGGVVGARPGCSGAGGERDEVDLDRRSDASRCDRRLRRCGVFAFRDRSPDRRAGPGGAGY